MAKAKRKISRRELMAGKRLTKAQIITELANSTDLDKKTVNRLFDELFGLIDRMVDDGDDDDG